MNTYLSEPVVLRILVPDLPMVFEPDVFRDAVGAAFEHESSVVEDYIATG